MASPGSLRKRLDGFLAREDFNNVTFLDIQPLLKDRQAKKDATDALIGLLPPEIWQKADHVAGLEARGFVFGGIIAGLMDKGFIMIRKPGKLPGNILSESYYKEYSNGKADEIFVQPGSGNVVIVDDILATGGTMSAAENLLTKAGYTVIGRICLANLSFLNTDKKTRSVLHYDSNIQLIEEAPKGPSSPSL